MTHDPRNTEGEYILLVDDDEAMLKSLARALDSEGFSRVLQCNDPREVADLVERHDVGVVLLDLMMPNMSGEAVLASLASKIPETPVIIVSAVDEVDTAVRCVRAGAFDYLVKPIALPRLITDVSRAFAQRQLKVENRELKQRMTAPGPQRPELFERIITRSPSMLSIFRYVESVAGSAEPVLIVGETGVGKELIAEAVHKASGVAGPLVAVNIAGIDKTAFADTLFGHTRGAFTGADRDRVGLIEEASGGSLLDEIGDLDYEMQTRLLRLLQEGDYFPLGSDKPRKSRCRVIAITNRDLRARIREGQFRDDLYFRLHAHLIHVPPLRERTEDLAPLVDHFLREAATTLGKPVPTPPKELFAYLAIHPFPGNVRELRAMTFDAVACHDKGVLSLSVYLAHMDRTGDSLPQRKSGEAAPAQRVAFGPDLPTLKEVTLRLFREAVQRAGGNQSVAARVLGVSRRTINRYVSSGTLDEPFAPGADEVDGEGNP